MGRKPECKIAGLRTETAYKAGAARRVCHVTRSRFRPAVKAGTHRRWVGGARARKVHVLIRRDLPDVPGSRACPKARASRPKPWRVRQKSAEGILGRRQSVRSIETLTREGRNSQGSQDRNGLLKARTERASAHRADLATWSAVSPRCSHKVVNRLRRPHA